MQTHEEAMMKDSGTLKITAHGDREIVMTRVFSAPRNLVFDAFTKPELVKRWLLGPDGWSMPVCEIDNFRNKHLPGSSACVHVSP
jgi:hypothetical protein